MLIKVESVLLFRLFYLSWKNVQDKRQICQVVQQKGCLIIIIQDNGVHENQIAAQIQIAHLENLSPINP